MRFKHFADVKTLKGKPECRDKKRLFSVTKTSAPTHSVYAAMNASAGLKPIVSYLNAISKGTTMSSSTMVNSCVNLLNSRKVSGDMFLLPLRILYEGYGRNADGNCLITTTGSRMIYIHLMDQMRKYIR